MSVIQRGEVWMVDLGLAAKVRPCLVLSIPVEGDERSLVTLIPHTTSVRTSRFECKLPTPFLRSGAFDAQSIVTVPSVRLLRCLGSLKPEQVAQIEEVVRRWLGLRA